MIQQVTYNENLSFQGRKAIKWGTREMPRSPTPLLIDLTKELKFTAVGVLFGDTSDERFSWNDLRIGRKVRFVLVTAFVKIFPDLIVRSAFSIISFNMFLNLRKLVLLSKYLNKIFCDLLI